MTVKWRPQPQHACLIPSCVAKVPQPGDRCAVHKVWTDGPHTHPCVKCKQPIVRGDLFRFLDNDPTKPVHAPCVDGKRRSAKRPATAPLGF